MRSVSKIPTHALRVKAPQPSIGAEKQCSTCAKIRAAAIAVANKIMGRK